MNTRKVLTIVRERGLDVVLKDGRPVLIRPQGNEGVTDALLAVLKLHRERIIEALKAERLT